MPNVGGQLNAHTADFGGKDDQPPGMQAELRHVASVWISKRMVLSVPNGLLNSPTNK